MASGDSPPQRRSFFGSLFCGAATVYKSLGFGAQEESEKCDRDTDTVEMSSMTQKDTDKSQGEPKMVQRSSDMLSSLEECVHESEENSALVSRLHTEKRELNKILEKRDKAILALQQESNVIIRKNQDLEAKCAHLSSSRSRNNDLVKTISDKTREVKELQAHIKMQSSTIAKLKDDFSVERSAEIAKYHELEDERDRLKEDFQSARETVDQLRKEASSSRQQSLASLPDAQFDCENSSCKKLHMESSFLKEELATARLSITSSQKMMAQLRKERDNALDESAVASFQAETFKNDFEAERKDRERAQGLLDGYRNKSSTTKLYEKTITDLEKELHTVNQNLMNLKKKLSIAEVELKKCRSGSTVFGQLKSTIEKKLTHEKEHYGHESEPSTFLSSEMNQVKAELKRTKDSVKQQKREIDSKEKNIASLNAAMKRKERELVKARAEIARGSKARIQHIETDTKLKTANKELRKAKSTLDNITKQSHKAKPRRGSKTDVQCSKTENVSIEDQAQYFKSIEMENEYLKSDLEDQKSQNDELKKLLMEMTEYSGVPEDEETKTAASGAYVPGFEQYSGEHAPGPQYMDHDIEMKRAISSSSNGVKPKPPLPPRGGKKGTGPKESINLSEVMLDDNKYRDPHIQAVSISNSQNTAQPEMPFLEPCGTATSTSHSASAVNYPSASQQPPFRDSWEDQARPNYGDLGNSEKSALRSSDTMDSFRHSQKPTRAGGASRHMDESRKQEQPRYMVPVNDQQYEYRPYRAGREMASNRMDRREGLSPTESYPSAESYQASFSGDQLSSGNPFQNPPSSHRSSRGVVGVDCQQNLAADDGSTQGAQNFPPKVPREEKHSYKQGFLVEQQQKYKSEDLLGKKSSRSDPSESSQSLPDPFYNPDTPDTIPEHSARGTHPPGYLVARNEKAIVGDKLKAVGGDSHAMAESSSEGSNGDQLHKDIDEEIHRFAEHVNEQVNPDLNRQVTEVVQLPLDPNLVCPICHKNYRIGQIQKFKKHVDSCF